MKATKILIKNIRKKSFRRKILRIFFVGSVALNLVAYQIFLPFSFSILTANAQEETVVEDEAVEAEQDDEAEVKTGEDEDQQGGEAEEEGSEEAVSDEPKESDGEDAQQQEEGGNEETGPSYDQERQGQNTESDAEIFIENENDTQMENEVSSTSQTGNNEVVEVGSESAPEEVAGLLNKDGAEEEDQTGETKEGILIQEQNEQDPELPGEEIQASQTTEEETKDDPAKQADEEQGADEEPVSTEETQNSEVKNLDQAENQDVAKDVEEQEPGAQIETGDAISNAEIINQVNQNITGINWVDTVINLYGLYEQDVDLNSIFLALLQEMMNQTSAITGGGEGIDLAVSNTNNADVSNVAVADSNTGGNSAETESGNAEIQTGDAQASANIVNIVNKNIVGNNWIFAVVNVFGYWSGNLVVPGEDLASFPYLQQYNEISVENTNEATVSNIVQANADTGGNTASSDQGKAEISTGDAVSTAVSTTIANTNITQNNWFSLAVNSTGNWLGTALNWEGEAVGNIFQYFFSAGQTNQSGGSLVVTNLNNADVSNVALSSATTGNNSVQSGAGSAQIMTGDAGAFSNVFNLINTNIVGNNWFFGIVNVMGAWGGDIEFAYPDLEISIDDGRSQAQAGDILEYVVNYKNIGKAPAENTGITFGLEGTAGYSGSTKSMKVSGSGYSWDVGTVEAGQTGSFVIKARVQDDLSDSVSDVVASVQIQTKTEEKEKGNNSDSDSTQAHGLSDKDDENYNGYNDGEKIDSGLKVTRLKTITGPVAGGEIVYNAIIVKNNGEGSVFDVSVREQMLDVEGTEIVKFIWPVGDMQEGNELLIEYELQVNQAALPGSYQFAAYAKGEDPYDDEVRSGRAILGMDVYRLGGYFASSNQETIVDDQPPFELLPTVQAATDSGQIMAAGANSCLPLPLWIWISALAAYGFLMNWSLFPWKDKMTQKQASKLLSWMRGFGTSFGGTMAMIAFWLAYRCDAMMWFVIATFLILFVHLLIKKRSQEEQISSNDPQGIVRV